MAKLWKDSKENLLCMAESCKKAILGNDSKAVAEHLAQMKIIKEIMAEAEKMAEAYVKENRITHTDEYGHVVTFVERKGSRTFNREKALSDLIELGHSENEYYTVGNPTLAIKVTLNKGNILK